SRRHRPVRALPSFPPRRSSDLADLLVVMGVNAATNAPRMLTALAGAYRRGAKIVHVNPLVEAASRRTIVPHEFTTMATRHATPTDRKSTRLNSSHLGTSYAVFC